MWLLILTLWPCTLHPSMTEKQFVCWRLNILPTGPLRIITLNTMLHVLYIDLTNIEGCLRCWSCLFEITLSNMWRSANNLLLSFHEELQHYGTLDFSLVMIWTSARVTVAFLLCNAFDVLNQCNVRCCLFQLSPFSIIWLLSEKHIT